MAITAKDISAYSINNRATSDLSSPVGGTINTDKSVEWVAPQGLVEVVSSDAGDIGIVAAAFGLDIGTNEFTDSTATTGQTPQPLTRSYYQVLRGTLVGGPALGDITIRSVTPIRTNTAQATGADSIQLDTGASAVDGFYNGMVVRLDDFQIRQIIQYTGATKVALVDRDWDTLPAATPVFEVSKGMYFPGPSAPFQVDEVWRLLYNARGAQPVGPTKVLYDKFFFRNNHATDAAPAAQVLMTDPTGFMEFGLAAAVNDVLTTTTRLTPPSGITFNTNPKSVPGGSLAAGARIGVWVKLTRPALAAQIIDVTVTFQLGWT